MASPLKVRLYGDPCLRRICDPVEGPKSVSELFIQDMIRTMRHYKGIGLAAPQVGVCQRFFVVDIGEGPHVFINPRILPGGGSVVMEEGCLSIPEVQIKVRRAARVVIQYQTLEGEHREQGFDGLMARVILHENDHLNGKLITDYATSLEKGKYEKILMALEARHAG